MPRFNQLSLVAAVLAAAATGAAACGFHNYNPKPSMVDLLINSEHAVLARPTAGNPFRYTAVEAVAGSTYGVELPQLVDTASRRRLAADANATVLFAREGSYGPWQKVSYIDATMRPVLDKMVARLPAWADGDDLDRFRTFMTYLDHPDVRVHTLALTELDRADYGFLVSHKLPLDPVATLARLDDPAQLDLRAIRVLLLGLSGWQGAQERLERGLAYSVQYENALAGAYATALIELDGPDRAVSVAQRYLTDPAVHYASKEALIEAMAIHSEYGETDMRETVSLALAEVLQQRPELASAMARQLGARGVWTLRDTLSDVVRQRQLTSMLDVLAVSQYVAMADGLAAVPNPVRIGVSDEEASN